MSSSNETRRAPVSTDTAGRDAPGTATGLLCIVVSLAREARRRASISAALEGAGVDFEMLDAVDATDGFDPAGDPRISPDRAPHLKAGECACALSHALALRRFLDSDASHLLVLEDDAIPTPAFARFVHDAHYRAFPMLLLYHSRARVDRDGGIELFDHIRARRLVMSCTAAVAYTLDRASAGQLLDANWPVRALADWPMDLSRLGARVLEPMVVDHPPRVRGQSSLQAARQAGGGRPRRRPSSYFTPGYLRRRWRKAMSVRIS